MSGKKKVVIIGLDGGTWEILNPLMQKGKAPFISRLTQEGAYGVLKSSIPPVTAPAWTSFLTGKNPGKHGLFDFQRIDFDTQERKLTFSTDCKSATLLDYLTEAGKRGIFVNIPLTYPPQPIDGMVVSGFPVPPDSSFVHPPEMQQQIREQGYLVDWMEIYKAQKSLNKATMIKMVDEAQLKVFASLLQEQDWDVAMIVVSGTDHISHLEWQKGNVGEVRRHYEFVDSLLMDLHRKGIFEDATVFVMSDHGFSGGSYAFFMNTWLASEGYITYKAEKDETYDIFLKGFRNTVYGERKGGLSKLLKTIGLTRENLIYLGKKTGAIKLEKYLPHSVISVFPSYEASIDWSKTKAYMMSNASKGININLQGREASGLVSKADYDELRKEIVGKLRQLKGADGQPIFQIADLKEDVYTGPYVSEAPDIVTWPSPNYKIRIGSNQKHYIRKVHEAQHSLDGMYILSGNDFVSEKRARALSIVDIAPTLLHVLGLPVPEDMDGKVALDLFDTNGNGNRLEVQYREPLAREAAQGSDGQDATDEGVLEKLRALGYI